MRSAARGNVALTVPTACGFVRASVCTGTRPVAILRVTLKHVVREVTAALASDVRAAQAPTEQRLQARARQFELRDGLENRLGSEKLCSWQVSWFVSLVEELMAVGVHRRSRQRDGVKERRGLLHLIRALSVSPLSVTSSRRYATVGVVAPRFVTSHFSVLAAT